MHRIVGEARSVGLLADAPAIVSEEEAANLEPDKVLYLCTGSQGEPRAALTRIARGEFRNVSLRAGDTVIFSSRVIPGNETAIHDLYNMFLAKGVDLITADSAPVHVSGHPARDELRQMYQWARPRIAIPVHGERRHILEHVKLARELQVSETVAVSNGDLVRLAPGPAAVIDETPNGRLYVDGGVLIDADDASLRDRRRLAAEGSVNVALVVGERKNAIVAGPRISLRGLSLTEGKLDEAEEDLASAARAGFTRLALEERQDDEAVQAALVRAVRKAAERLWGKRPLVDVSVLRV
jgi:ribonuclease J